MASSSDSRVSRSAIGRGWPLRTLSGRAVWRAAVALGAIGLGACGVDGDGIRPAAERTTTFAPTGLGASLEVPESWREVEDWLGAGFDFSIMEPDGDAAVLAMRAIAYGTDVVSVAAASRSYLTRIGARFISKDTTSIDDHPTAVLRYSLPDSDETRAFVTEYDVIVGDGTVIRIAIGERQPESNADLLARIAETIELGDLSTSVDVEELSVDDTGFLGEYRVSHDRPCQPGPAVLLLTGYGGGMPPQGIQLARAGYPTLSLAYYNLPTLPDVLSNIPLEYFEGALRWLREQPEVDPQRVIVWGYSRGGEAALLLGATYPELVHGVVANVPSNVVNGSFDVGGAVWTLDGAPLPFNDRLPTSEAVNAPEAEIQVERIAGPVLLACGELDEEWASCPMARAIESRLDTHARLARHKLLSYPNLGHFVNVPPLSTTANVREGGDEAWRATLEFLEEVGLGA